MPNLSDDARRRWVDRIFDAKAAQSGGVVRRSVQVVEDFGRVDMLVEAVKERGFHMVQNGDQYVILCNPGDVRVVL